MAISALKQSTHQALMDRRDRLIGLSHAIHARPELAFEEVFASELLAHELVSEGFDVDVGVSGLPTAFRASKGVGPLTVAVLAEYDALPGIGHACGHNVIAAASVGVAVALAAFVDDLGITLRIIGTPAEERGGGKIVMLERGEFDDVDIAMMVHPAPVDIEQAATLAMSQFDVEYRGRAAHASASPHLGVNAADAMTVAQVSVGLLRQQLRSSDQVHGVVHSSGDAANVIPAVSAAAYCIRSDTLDHLERLQSRVVACFDAGALATGCDVDVTPAGPAYAEFRHDAALGAIYRANAEGLGRRFADRPGGRAARGLGSTDMGNVSHRVRSIHPMIGIGSLPAVNHQPAFADAAVSPAADDAILDGALALAWTVLDIVTPPPEAA